MNTQLHPDTVAATAEQQWPPEWLEQVAGEANANAVRAYCNAQRAREKQELQDILDPNVHIMHFSA